MKNFLTFLPYHPQTLHDNLIPHYNGFRSKPCIKIEPDFIIFLFYNFFKSTKTRNYKKVDYSNSTVFTVQTPFYLILI